MVHISHSPSDREGRARASPRAPIGVIIVSEIRLYREGLAVCLDVAKGIAVYGTAADSTAALAIHAATPARVALVDVAANSDVNTIHRLASASPSLHIVALSVAEDERSVLACIEAGISSYVARDGSLDDLREGIQSVVRGEAHCSPMVARRLMGELHRRSSDRSELIGDPMSRLTPRQRQITELIDEGLSNSDIADRLFIGVSTVKNHVHTILEKLQVHRRGEAAAIMRRRGLAS